MLKALKEKRNGLVEQMRTMTETAANEVRALTEEENTQFKALEDEVRALDDTIAKADQEFKALDMAPETVDTETRDAEDVEKRDIADFAAYIRSEVNETREVTNLTKGDNGAVIPYTIANMIIKEITEICPIYAAATKFNVKGTLSIPYYDESDGTITVGYADEFVDLTSSSAKFANIELTGHLFGSLSKISRSLLNNSDFDLVNFVVQDMAEKISVFIEKALLFGDDKQDGMKDVKLTVKTSNDAPTADELITIQETLRDAFQGPAFWIMGRETRKAIRLLKDNENRYMLNPDLTSAWGYTLLGKPVYVTDAITDETIFYGDYSGLAVKEIENPQIQVLHELFALSHVDGVVVWGEMDSKIFNAQKIVKYGKNVQTMAATSPVAVSTVKKTAAKSE